MTTTIGYDPYGIVPKGASVAKVSPFEFQVRTLVDYDARFLQDRLHSSIFVNGNPVGVYAAMRLGEGMADSPRQALERFGPDLERNVVDEFMGLGYRKQVRDLEDRVNALQAFIDRPRWWQFRPLRREWAKFRRQLAERIAPVDDLHHADQ